MFRLSERTNQEKGKDAQPEAPRTSIDILGVARGIANIVKDVGVPVAVLAVVFLMYMGFLPSPVTAITDQHRVMMEQHVDAQAKIEHAITTLESISRHEEEKTRLLRLICKRLSKTNGYECD
jgi:hypothetical protein